jgi:hypothetical protein
MSYSTPNTVLLYCMWLNKCADHNIPREAYSSSSICLSGFITAVAVFRETRRHSSLFLHWSGSFFIYSENSPPLWNRKTFSRFRQNTPLYCSLCWPRMILCVPSCKIHNNIFLSVTPRAINCLLRLQLRMPFLSRWCLLFDLLNFSTLDEE